jgi:hypothetical protein
MSTKTTPISANIDPTDSSIPAVMITSPWPIENSPYRPTRLAMFTRFTVEMKRGCSSATTQPITRIRIASPSSFLIVPDVLPDFLSAMPPAAGRRPAASRWVR